MVTTVKFEPASDSTVFQTGDILKVDSFVPLVDHFALVFSRFGRQYIIENKFLTGGLGVEPLDEYRKRRNIMGYLRNEKTQLLTDEEIIEKAEACKHIGYEFTGFNCEEFVRHITGVDWFDQRKKWLIAVSAVGLGGIAGYFIFKKHQIGKWWGMLAGAGSIALIFIMGRQIRRGYCK